jgi:hypothetical protein
MKLIGLIGKAQSGKDTVARLILRHHFGYDMDEEDYFYLCKEDELSNLLSFAYPMYQALSAMTGHSVIWLMKNKDETINGITVRHLLQTLGTEWGRETIGNDWWVNLLKTRLVERLQTEDLTIVTDIRFDNEAQLIRDNGGEIWHIFRDVEIMPHASENGITPYSNDHIILNNLSIDELKVKVLEHLE